MEKQKAYIAYRGNDLLDQDVPVIARALEEVGYDVRTQKFAKGTPEEEIGAWEKENHEDLKECGLILSDGTFRLTIPFELENELHFPKEDDVFTLDTIVDNVLFEEVTGRKTRVDYKTEMEDTKSAYLSVLGKMQLPKKVYVVSNKITAHEPFHKMNPKQASEILADWFREAGVTEVKIVDFPDEIPIEDKNQGNWYIADRHIRMYDPEEGYTLLQVPFGSFWQDVNKQGMIQSVDYSEKLAEYVKQRFQEGK